MNTRSNGKRKCTEKVQMNYVFSSIAYTWLMKLEVERWSHVSNDGHGFWQLNSDFLVNLKLIHFIYLNNTDIVPFLSGSSTYIVNSSRQRSSHITNVYSSWHREVASCWSINIILSGKTSPFFPLFPPAEITESWLVPLFQPTDLCLRSESSLTKLKQWNLYVCSQG